MLNFDRNLMNLFGSCEKLPKDPGGNILVKYLEDRGGEVGREEVEQRHEGGDSYEEGGDEVDKS